MLPAAATQCNIYFQLANDLIGGMAGSLGFFLNLIAIRWIMQKWTDYKGSKTNDITHA